jgi:serine/threonine protein kinase
MRRKRVKKRKRERGSGKSALAPQRPLGRDMAQVTFELDPGFRIGNYRVEKRLGSGWTAETYLVEEIPTHAQRALKIYDRFEDTQRIKNLKDFAHYCWFLEQVSFAGLLPRYYHFGHILLKDEIGHYFMVQEYICGVAFASEMCTRSMIQELVARVKLIHSRGYALGDWEPENLLVSSGVIRMIDCEYGRHDKPNTNKNVDVCAIKNLFGAIVDDFL